MTTPLSDDDLLDIQREAVRKAMNVASERDNFASNMSRESIIAGLRAVVEAARNEPLEIHRAWREAEIGSDEAFDRLTEWIALTDA